MSTRRPRYDSVRTHEKFERDARRDAELAQRHKQRVRFQGGRYQCVCSCGWTGEWRSSRQDAAADGPSAPCAV